MNKYERFAVIFAFTFAVLALGYVLFRSVDAVDLGVVAFALAAVFGVFYGVYGE